MSKYESGVLERDIYVIYFFDNLLTEFCTIVLIIVIMSEMSRCEILSGQCT